MSHQRRASAVLAAIAAVSATALQAGGAASAQEPAAPTYSVTVGSIGAWTNPDDTPASLFLDRDGTFHYEQAHSLYGASDPREWLFYQGTDFDHTTADETRSNHDTTAQCNNSPTGVEATNAPAGSGYSQRNYCDISGIWVDPDSGDWYGLVHNEFTPQPFGDRLHYDAIDYAVSTDDGRTWDIKGHAITSPYSTKRGDTAAFPQQTFYYGDGDQRLLVDPASGYFYAFYGSRVVDKGGSWRAFYEHVARAPISKKMASGSWQKWYDGHWSQPGVGGKESNMTPVTADSPTGYTAPDKEYDPANPGTAAQQVAAGTMPATSPLFVMDVTYDAYLGLYIGEPQAVDQSGNAPQEYYATRDLATQRWFELGDTGSYHTASWYRWFLDGANATSTSIVGRTFRSYCSYACSASDDEYANVTIDSSAPAAPVRSGAAYRVVSGGGQALDEVGSTGRTTSTRGARDAWTFTATGDGAYTIADGAGRLLGVDASTTASRAWGTRPTVGRAASTGPSVGQQWFVVPTTSSAGHATGTFRLVNRYSGLVLGLPATHAGSAETTPARSWSGAGRTPAEQTLTLTRVGRG
ncbi:MAG: RICIN domain-containing protein [Nocardioides sp.]|nr:RICIN domain-containing protein [Nocardioides sp.]